MFNLLHVIRCQHQFVSGVHFCVLLSIDCVCMLMLIGRKQKSRGSIEFVSRDQNQLTRATLLEVIRLKRLWADPLLECFQSSACFSLSHITDPYFSEKHLAQEAEWLTVVWMLTVGSAAYMLTPPANAKFLQYVLMCSGLLYFNRERGDTLPRSLNLQ